MILSVNERRPWYSFMSALSTISITSLTCVESYSKLLGTRTSIRDSHKNWITLIIQLDDEKHCITFNLFLLREHYVRRGPSLARNYCTQVNMAPPNLPLPSIVFVARNIDHNAHAVSPLPPLYTQPFAPMNRRIETLEIVHSVFTEETGSPITNNII